MSESARQSAQAQASVISSQFAVFAKLTVVISQVVKTSQAQLQAQESQGQAQALAILQLKELAQAQALAIS
jgi:hypothetical protein